MSCCTVRYRLRLFRTILRWYSWQLLLFRGQEVQPALLAYLSTFKARGFSGTLLYPSHKIKRGCRYEAALEAILWIMKPASC
jgi:hypothetical protein